MNRKAIFFAGIVLAAATIGGDNALLVKAEDLSKASVEGGIDATVGAYIGFANVNQEEYLQQHLPTDNDANSWPYELGDSALKSIAELGQANTDFLRLGRTTNTVPTFNSFTQNAMVLEPDQEYTVYLDFWGINQKVYEAKTDDFLLQAMMIVPKKVLVDKEYYIMGNYVDRTQGTPLAFDEIIVIAREDLRLRLAAEPAIIVPTERPSSLYATQFEDWSKRYRGIVVGGAQVNATEVENGGVAFRFTTESLSASQKTQSANKATNEDLDTKKEQGSGSKIWIWCAVVSAAICLLLVGSLLRIIRNEQASVDLGEAYDRAMELRTKEDEKRKK